VSFACICTLIVSEVLWYTPDLRAQGVGYQISTLAGSNWIGDGGPATLAILTQAEGIAADSAGNLYLADAAQNRIRKITPAGLITTLGGTGLAGFSGDGGPAVLAQFNSPYGLVVDGIGNLYVADLGNARVRMIALDGTVSTVAGGGSLPAGGPNEGSAATVLALGAPRNVTLDGSGALYFSDFTAQRVYRVALGASGALTTIAGTGVQGFSGDNGPATHAQLSYPAGLAFDRTGALYIADSQNHVVRKIAGELISSIARAVTPTGLAVDLFGTLYVADPGAGQLLTFPANAAAAAFAIPALDLTFGPDGYLYASQGSTAIRVSFTGPTTVLAGGGSFASGDQGPANNALLQHPSGVAADTLGNIYIADRDNNRIRKVAPDGIITTVAGTGAPGTGDATTAGSGTASDGDGGPATQAQLNSPSSVTVDAQGNLYIADTGHSRVRRVTPAGIIQAVSFPGLVSPVYALSDSAGNLYVSDTVLGAIVSVTPLGAISSLADQLNSPGGFAFDPAGNLYFAETGAGRVRRRDTAGNLTTVAAGVWSAPRGIAISGAPQEIGSPLNVLVADSGLDRILSIDSSGVVTAIAGTGIPGFSGDGSDAASAELNSPWDLAIDSQGNIYTADLNNNRVRRLTPSASGAAPLILVSAVNAASLAAGPLAPGMLLDVLNTGLTAADAPNVQVLFLTGSANTTAAAQISAQILSVDSGTVVVVVPTQIAAAGNVAIQVLNSNAQVTQITAVMAAAAPALFTSAAGQAMAVNEDGTLNSATNATARGSIVVLYGTGQGISSLPVSVTVGGNAANVLYTGPVAGYPGLWQLNVQMPGGFVAPGTMAVIVNVGGASSQVGVSLTLN
jgi:uncharacterized protein (TIGR03437 family)